MELALWDGTVTSQKAPRKAPALTTLLPDNFAVLNTPPILIMGKDQCIELSLNDLTLIDLNWPEMLAHSHSKPLLEITKINLYT